MASYAARGFKNTVLVSGKPYFGKKINTMGLFDFLKSGKKENKATEHGFISGGGKGLSFEEANKAREAFMQLLDTSDDQSKLFNAASGMMLGQKF